MQASDVTQNTKEQIAGFLSNNGSGQSFEEEMEMFGSVLKYSQSGELPAQVFGIGIPAKLEMKDAFINLMQQLNNARYVVIANSRLYDLEYLDRELIATNFDITPNGQIVDLDIINTYLNHEFGLNQIPEPEEE